MKSLIPINPAGSFSDLPLFLILLLFNMYDPGRSHVDLMLLRKQWTVQVEVEKKIFFANMVQWNMWNMSS